MQADVLTHTPKTEIIGTNKHRMLTFQDKKISGQLKR